MVSVVANDEIILTQHSWYNALIDAEASGEAQTVFLAYKLGNLLLQLNM